MRKAYHTGTGRTACTQKKFGASCRVSQKVTHEKASPLWMLLSKVLLKTGNKEWPRASEEDRMTSSITIAFNLYLSAILMRCKKDI